jgi:hypothetical protein
VRCYGEWRGGRRTNRDQGANCRSIWRTCRPTLRSSIHEARYEGLMGTQTTTVRGFSCCFRRRRPCCLSRCRRHTPSNPQLARVLAKPRIRNVAGSVENCGTEMKVAAVDRVRNWSSFPVLRLSKCEVCLPETSLLRVRLYSSVLLAAAQTNGFRPEGGADCFFGGLALDQELCVFEVAPPASNCG